MDGWRQFIGDDEDDDFKCFLHPSYTKPCSKCRSEYEARKETA